MVRRYLSRLPARRIAFTAAADGAGISEDDEDEDGPPPEDDGEAERPPPPPPSPSLSLSPPPLALFPLLSAEAKWWLTWRSSRDWVPNRSLQPSTMHYNGIKSFDFRHLQSCHIQFWSA